MQQDHRLYSTPHYLPTLHSLSTGATKPNGGSGALSFDELMIEQMKRVEEVGKYE